MTSHRVAHTSAFGLVLAFMAIFLVGHLGVLDLHAETGHARRPAANGTAAPARALRLGRVLFAPTFAAGTRLVTNDYAYFNPTAAGAARSFDWIVTSGSLFTHNHAGWTGVPDSLQPDINSNSGTGSAIFRLVTRRRDFDTVAISFNLLNQGYVTTQKTPAHAWDGVHLFLHYRSQHSLYALTINRRDSTVLVKKKRPGGPANGGTYTTLAPPVHYTPPLDRWQHILAVITTNGNRTVTITAYLNGKLLTSATDTGADGPPLIGQGAIGLRGDNTQFQFRHFLIRALAGPRST